VGGKLDPRANLFDQLKEQGPVMGKRVQVKTSPRFPELRSGQKIKGPRTSGGGGKSEGDRESMKTARRGGDRRKEISEALSMNHRIFGGLVSSMRGESRKGQTEAN